jgi:hypothetical protein
MSIQIRFTRKLSPPTWVAIEEPYVIAKSTSISELEREVKDLIACGMLPSGGIHAAPYSLIGGAGTGFEYFQAMIAPKVIAKSIAKLLKQKLSPKKPRRVGKRERA